MGASEEVVELYSDWLLQWGFPDGREAVKSNYLVTSPPQTCQPALSLFESVSIFLVTH